MAADRDEMSESEMIAHALGMKACLAGKSRQDNPWDFSGGQDGLDRALCRAWFRGFDDAKRGGA